MNNEKEEWGKTLKTLKNLVEICKQGEEGFETAAENIRNSEYETLLRSYAHQRAKFASELESEMKRMGEDSKGNTLQGLAEDVGGTLHRGWINLKSAVIKRDDEAILNECKTGESAAIKAYRDALESRELLSNLKPIISLQFSAIEEAKNRIEILSRIEDQTKYIAKTQNSSRNKKKDNDEIWRL